jgi:hypothetical protein
MGKYNILQDLPFWILVSIDAVILTGSSNPGGSNLVVFITKQPTLIQLKITQFYFNSTGYTKAIQKKYV